jgi:hypothetical protein
VAVGVDPDDGDRVEVVELRRENRVGRRRPTGERRHLHTPQQRTASMIMSVTMSRCEVIATWEESTSRVSAFLRWAVKRSASGGMALSCRAISYQDGMVFPAGAPVGSPRVLRAAGRCEGGHDRAGLGGQVGAGLGSE